ncbi:formylglycine-generating enzyme family protein [Chryseobacterium koreense]
MIKIMHILLIVSGIFFISCEEKSNEVPNSFSFENQKEEPIHPDVKMISIKGGKYQPFYGKQDSLILVKDFEIDERPVTNAEFLDFVKKNPKWKRSQVKTVFVDSTYLKDWKDDETLGADMNPNAPVTFVSWFAAKAYAKSAGKRLPTIDEWEFVAMADETSSNARKKPSYSSDIIKQYEVKFKEKNPVKQSKPNYYGVYNMFDLVWEWTGDFNSVLTTNDSRTAEYDDKGLFCASAATTSTDILNYASFMRYAFRQSLNANYTVANLGFRCAKDITIK